VKTRDDRIYAVFSKSGFTNVAENKAERLGIALISIDDIMEDRFGLLDKTAGHR